MSKIDLHIHSTASDGTFTPAKIVELSIKLGLQAIAITDHDTLAGLDEASQVASLHDIELIRGCEINSTYKSKTVHLLAYFVPKNIPEIDDILTIMRSDRIERNEKILAKLRTQGIKLEYTEIANAVGRASFGRPHIAQALCDNGHTKTQEEAFKKYLKKGQLAHAPRQNFPSKEIIQIFKKAGCLVVLAHPIFLGKHTRKCVRDCATWGLDGLEIYYPLHNEANITFYKELANEYNLVATAGSDFHGANKPNIRLGAMNNENNYSLLECMKKRHLENLKHG